MEATPKPVKILLYVTVILKATTEAIKLGLDSDEQQIQMRSL